MRYEPPAIERRAPITALLDQQVSPAPDDISVQPIWRQDETRED
jgi:hypothetical protein